MLPSIFGENLFDSFFSEPFRMFEREADHELYGKHAAAVMRTDVRETDNTYELDIDLPGFKKPNHGKRRERLPHRDGGQGP